MLVTALALLTAMLALRARVHDVRPAHASGALRTGAGLGVIAGLGVACAGTAIAMLLPATENFAPRGTSAFIEPLACVVALLVLVGPDVRRNSPRQLSLLIAAAIPFVVCWSVAATGIVTPPSPAPLGLIAAALCEATLAYGRESRLIYSAKSIAVDATGDGIAVVDSSGRLLETNVMAREALEEMSGVVTGGEISLELPERISEMLEDPNACKQLLQTAGKRFFEVWTTSRDATRGRRGIRAVVLRDVTARRIGERKLLQLAHNDSLTGLSNRRRFIDQLKQSLHDASQRDHQVALLYIDLDRFKEINDTQGHGAGDHLLREVAERLQSPLPVPESNGGRAPQPLVSRLGGDEFAVVLPRLVNEEDAESIADEILLSISDPIRLNERTMSVSASIGIAVSPRDGSDVETLVKHADAALYAAKGLGRNRYAFYRPSYGRASDRTHQIEQELRSAIERDEFELHYQPKVDLETQTVSGFEALARWNNRALGSVGPNEFIPIAEERGLITAIGTWGIREACRQLREWKEAGLELVPVSVNVSSSQFNDSDVRQIVTDALQSNELDPTVLELELTERLLLEDNDATAVSLRDLRAIGVRISLDDFGTGYSALTYLNQFPLDIVKMDRGFFREIEDSNSAAGIVAAVISMCHSLGLNVVAEGVDAMGQLELLHEMGCEQVQGFLFAPALPADQVRRYFAQAGGPRPEITPTTVRLEAPIGSRRKPQPVATEEVVSETPPDSAPIVTAELVPESTEFITLADLENSPEAADATAVQLDPRDPVAVPIFETEEVAPPRRPARRTPCVLVFDDHDESLSSVTQRMICLGIQVHHTSEPDEARAIIEDGARVHIVVASPQSELLIASELVECVAKESGDILPSLLVLGEEPTVERLEQIRTARPRWVVWAPFDDTELRFFMNAAVSLQYADSPRQTRVPLDAPVYIRAGARRDSGVLSSLSAAGGFIQTSEVYKPDETLRLELDLPTGRMRVFAKVLYSQSGEEESVVFAEQGIGVHFLDLDAITERVIQETVDQRAFRYIP
jgi:diguanylate cyclase (GGDEF)-like protein